jgi:hypothetical protein
MVASASRSTRRRAALVLALWSPIALCAAALTATILWAFVGLPVLAVTSLPLRLAVRAGTGRPSPRSWAVVGVGLAASLTAFGFVAALVQPEQWGLRAAVATAVLTWGATTIAGTIALAQPPPPNPPVQNGRSTLH